MPHSQDSRAGSSWTGQLCGEQYSLAGRDSSGQISTAVLKGKNRAERRRLALRERRDGKKTGLPSFDRMTPYAAGYEIRHGEPPGMTGTLLFPRIHTLRNWKSHKKESDTEPPTESPENQRTRTTVVAGNAWWCLCMVVAVTGLFFCVPVYSQAPDIVWLVASFSTAALVTKRTLPAPSLALATAAAGFGASLHRVSGIPIPNELFCPATAAALWFLLERYGRLNHALLSLSRVALAGSLALVPIGLSGIAQIGDAWIVSLFTAAAMLTHRAFALGLFADLRVTLSALSFIPLSCGLMLSIFTPYTYGSTWITAVNLVASLAPLGCVILAVRSAARDTQESRRHDQREHQEFPHLRPSHEGHE